MCLCKTEDKRKRSNRSILSKAYSTVEAERINLICFKMYAYMRMRHVTRSNIFFKNNSHKYGGPTAVELNILNMLVLAQDQYKHIAYSYNFVFM